ncbi:sugar MFS transporter [Phycisphaerales bacterium AB-hyl4]|uniref:Sugar MFS transporter n=1 Tax=Natronomicrosphaera hydrolytica TaxID=3242702 RepID=A0ABV4U7N5_9BACT
MPRLRLAPLDYAAAMGFLAYSSSAVVTPIALLILARELSFGLAAGGLLEVMRAVLILAVMLTSAFAAARWGKANVLGVGSLVLGCGLMLYAISPTYGTILLAMGLVGVGGGFVEALTNPLVQELHPNDSGRYLNFANGFWSIGVLVTVLIGGELLTQGVSWRFVVAGVGAMSIVAGLLYLSLRRGGVVVADVTSRHVLGHKRDILLARKFWLFAVAMFLAGGVEGGFTFWIASYLQLHYDALPRAGGIGTACFAAGMIVGRIGGGWWAHQHRLRPLLIGSAAAALVMSLLVPMAPNLGTAYVMLAFAGLTIACFWPSIQSYAVDRMSVDMTSLFILLSCAGIPGFAFTAWLMGIVGDHAGLHASFLILPGMVVLLLVTLLVDGKPGNERPSSTVER